MKKYINIKMATALAVASIALLSITGLTGCSKSNSAAISAWGKKHRVTLYGNNGVVIGSWETSGKVEDIGGDGCYFADDKTGLLVEIRGTTLIEVIP